MSFLFWAQFARCVVILYKLSTLDDPAWDRGAVCNTVDLLKLLDQMMDNLELASSEAGEQADDDLLKQITLRGRMSRAWLSTKMVAKEGEESAWAATNSDENMLDQNQQSQMDSMGFGNDMWFGEFLAGFR